MNIYLHPSGVKKELKNAYIGEYKGFVPWVNTLAYYPLETDTKDYSWNNRNLTNSWITFDGGVWVFNGNAIWYYTNNSLWNNLNNFTYSVYVNPSSITSWTFGGNVNINRVISIIQYGTIPTYDKTLSLCNSSQAQWYNYYNWLKEVYTTWISINTWCYLTYTWDGNTIKIYKNWVLWQSLACWWSYTWYTQATLCVWNNTNTQQIQKYYGKISNVIIENKARTAQEVQDYYNQTKSNYWL
jgi:hypothetical protein